MKLIYKTIEENNRGMYIYYPQGPVHSAFKRCSITILQEADEEASILKLLNETGLTELADQQQLILAFPIPVNQHWNADWGGVIDDVSAFPVFQNAMLNPSNQPLEFLPNGVPTHETMLNTWHVMNDARYLIGIESGADLACTLAACCPENIAAVLCVHGKLNEEAQKRAVLAPIPISLVNCTKQTLDYFVTANAAELLEDNGDRIIYKNRSNPLQCVVDSLGSRELTSELVRKVWDKMFREVRRCNSAPFGDCETRMDRVKAGFEFFLEDNRLEENKNTAHTWFTHVPSSVKEKPEKKVPLLMFFHGGSDNPEEAAEMSKFHELGEKEGFITVYPWGTNRTQWNCNMLDDEADDVSFAISLIRYMIANYPVDETRIYLSGFSNGAAQAQVVAMTHPELIAAICHIDSNWPGERVGVTDIQYEAITPFYLAIEKKKNFDYRMPVWYIYGSREPSYPVYRGCTQQNQYDFWKKYNNIEVLPTPERENPHPCGCGVPGQKYERLLPSRRHPLHAYDVQRFYSRDEEPVNYYNYVAMLGKGHDIAEMDAALGWEYVKQFSRLSDGNVIILKEEKK